MSTPPDPIDAYIQSYPDHVQKLLQEIRATIRRAAPEAVEKISYGIPTFRLAGNLVHFGAYQNHISLYPTPSGVSAFMEELKGYKTSKSTIHFPLDRPIPHDLIDRIVRFRVQENLERAARKK